VPIRAPLADRILKDEAFKTVTGAAGAAAGLFQETTPSGARRVEPVVLHVSTGDANASKANLMIQRSRTDTTFATRCDMPRTVKKNHGVRAD